MKICKKIFYRRPSRICINGKITFWGIERVFTIPEKTKFFAFGSGERDARDAIISISNRFIMLADFLVKIIKKKRACKMCNYAIVKFYRIKRPTGNAM